MVVWMVVMNRCAIVVLLGVGERISNIVRGKVGHVMRILVDLNWCMCVFIHVMYWCVIMVVLIIVVNMSLSVYRLMNDCWLVIYFMCHDGFVVDFVSHDRLVVDLMCHDWLVNDFMCYDVMVLLWCRILC